MVNDRWRYALASLDVVALSKGHSFYEATTLEGKLCVMMYLIQLSRETPI